MEIYWLFSKILFPEISLKKLRWRAGWGSGELIEESGEMFFLFPAMKILSHPDDKVKVKTKQGLTWAHLIFDIMAHFQWKSMSLHCMPGLYVS